MNSMNRSRDVIANWQPHHETLFGRHAIKLNHRLTETGLFTREALGRVIERCPKNELGLESVTVQNDRPQRIYGELGKASGLEAIAAIEKGRMWMNIRRVMDWAPEYRTLLDTIFDEFEARMRDDIQQGIPAEKQGVHAPDVVALGKQLTGQNGADVAGATCNQDSHD